MSDQPTPETDACWDDRTGCNILDHARSLERERDEARAQAKKLEGAYEDATNYYARWSQLIEERDKARGLARQMSESNQVLLADVRFYRNAWEQLKKEKP